MQVVIPKSKLDEARACPAYLASPEWDKEQQALVYADWDKTVERLLSSATGSALLDWLVKRSLVPMTKEELSVAKNARAMPQRAREFISSLNAGGSGR